MIHKVLLTALCFGLSAGVLGAHPDLFSDWDEYHRALAGLTPDRFLVIQKSAPSFQTGLRVNALYLANEGYPYGGNDFGLWQGRGHNGSLRLEARWQNEHLRLWFGPQIHVSQNKEFELAPSGRPPYGDVNGATSDTPQRLGPDPLLTWDWAESLVEIQMFPFALGFGTEATVFGFSRSNPLLASANSAGFPHVYAWLKPTELPWPGPWGQFEAYASWGWLKESPWFDADSSNDWRFLQQVFVGYRPAWTPHFRLGAGRAVTSYAHEFDPGDLLAPFSLSLGGDFGDPSYLGSDRKDQRISLVWSWSFPSQGFEFYGEWGRNDFSPDFRLLVTNFNRTQAYTVGFHHTWPVAPGHRLYLTGEVTNLTLDMEGLINFNGYSLGANFYAHSLVTQGYSHEGQTLGAWIGNGSNSQSLTLGYRHEKAFAQFLIRRFGRNSTYLYVDPQPGEELLMDADLSWNLSLFWQEGPFSAGAALAYHKNFNRNYKYALDLDSWRLELMTSWRFPEAPRVP